MAIKYLSGVVLETAFIPASMLTWVSAGRCGQYGCLAVPSRFRRSRIPGDIAKRLSEGGDVSRRALEAIALEGYREQTLTRLHSRCSA
jgi:hypothetical protein